MADVPHRPDGLKKRRWLIGAAALLLVCAAVVAALTVRLTPYARNRIVEALGERFDADIELRTFRVSVFPRPSISGEGLVVRRRALTDVPPLITVGSFSAGTGFHDLWSRPLRLDSVALHGLELRLSRGPRPDDGREAEQRDRDSASGRQESRLRPPRPAREVPDAPPTGASPLVIGRITSADARLEIASSKPGKPPRVFEIHDLVLDDFGLDRPARFDATLTNPTPEGLIETTGTFGPWQKDDPRLTPIEGTYTFTDANLDTIKGLGGRLSSKGRFTGVMERLDVDGDTVVPDFSLDIAGRPVHLETQFKAVVDGTSGDTWLTPVDATLLSSEIRAEGAVVRAEGVKGRLISLDVAIDKGRVEDLLTLAVKSPKPLLVGGITLATRLELPPGDRDVVEKLRLKGQFALREARFTNFNIQKRIDMLSRRGRGQVDDTDGESVVSNMKGRFTLNDGVLMLQDLTFGVPGATVRLAGRYSLVGETLAFRGELLLDAELSEMTSGWKAAVARLAQPLFRRPGGGSRIPIRIEGTREKPAFRLDIGRALTPGN